MTTIEAISCAFPANLVTNEQLASEYPNWDFERLEKRTGVLTRYVAAEQETALDRRLVKQKPGPRPKGKASTDAS